MKLKSTDIMEFADHIDMIKQKISTGISQNELDYLVLFIMTSLPFILPRAHNLRENALERVPCSDDHERIGKAIVHNLDIGFIAIDQFVKDKNKNIN